MQPSQIAPRLARAIEEYLLAWVLLAVLVGGLVPRFAVVTDHSTLILAVMVGSISLTITLGDVRTVSRHGLAAILGGHVAMPALAVARPLGLSPELTARGSSSSVRSLRNSSPRR